MRFNSAFKGLSYVRILSTTLKFKIFKRDLSESDNIKLESE